MRQYALADEAVRLGWARADVVVIDADLGASGRFGTEREGFREVVAKVCLGEAGAIFGLEVSRLARSSADFARLLELARLTDTLLVDSDGIYDLTDVNDRLLLGLKGSMSEAELHILATRLHGAKRAAAMRGELRFPLPVGYVYDDQGICVIDPDMEVQAAIRDVFAAFAVGGSAYAVVSAFVGRRFPLRAFGGIWAGRLRWGRLTHARVLGVLNNPCYAGSYVFGRYTTRRRVDPDGGVHTGIRLLPRAQWPVVIHDHHEGYITWADFEANQAKLEANCTHDKARPPREGLALCQGIILCGSCGRPMTTRYHHGGRAAYECSASRADQQATETCRSIAARGVDEAVAQRLLAALAPEQIALALATAGEVADRHTRTHRAAELAVERARYEADRAERAFTRVEPENRLVARTLETRWEDRLTALAEAEAALETVRQTRPPLPEPAALHALATDLPRLWNAPDTRDRDRKRLLRTLIADITVLPETDRHQARIGIRWHTGATDEVTLTRGTPRTLAAAIELITRLGPRLTDQELVTELATAGLRTGKGRPFDVKAVRWARHAYRVRAPRTVPFQDNEIGIDEMARILGVGYSSAYYWITHHRLPARQDRSGRWCVPWNQAIEADCRQRIARSRHLNPVGPGARPIPEVARHGAITVQQAAARLGVHDYDIYYWIRTKRLPAHRTDAGRVTIPWNDDIEADCHRYAACTRPRTSQSQTTTMGGAV